MTKFNFNSNSDKNKNGFFLAVKIICLRKSLEESNPEIFWTSESMSSFSIRFFLAQEIFISFILFSFNNPKYK